MPASGPIGEERRVALMNRLIDALGEEEARTLMESLPPVSWHDLATKDDMRAAQEARDALEHRLRTEMNAEFTKVYAELHSLRVETAAEFKLLRVETAAEFKTLRAENKEFQGAITLQLARQTRTMVFTMLGLAMPTWGAILAVGLG